MNEIKCSVESLLGTTTAGRGGGGGGGGGVGEEHDADRRQQLKTSLAFFPT